MDNRARARRAAKTGPLVPLPAPLERALDELRRRKPPVSFEAALRAALDALPEAGSKHRTKLLLLGGVILAALLDLGPLIAAV